MSQSCTIVTLKEYSPDIAASIRRLFPHLSASFVDTVVDESLLRAIIDSPHHDQLIAYDQSGAVVGIATLSLTFGVAVGCNAWLEDFVVDPAAQGGGIGGALWEASLAWSREHGAQSLKFTSRPTRTAAHAFYLKRGATIRDTDFFKKDIL